MKSELWDINAQSSEMFLELSGKKKIQNYEIKNLQKKLLFYLYIFYSVVEKRTEFWSLFLP